MVLMFSECERQKCLNVTVTQDLVKEPDEIFTVHLNRTIDLSPRIDLDPVDERIEIVDDDSEQFMIFTPPIYKQNMCINIIFNLTYRVELM